MEVILLVYNWRFRSRSPSLSRYSHTPSVSLPPASASASRPTQWPSNVSLRNCSIFLNLASLNLSNYYIFNRVFCCRQYKNLFISFLKYYCIKIHSEYLLILIFKLDLFVLKFIFDLPFLI